MWDVCTYKYKDATRCGPAADDHPQKDRGSTNPLPPVTCLSPVLRSMNTCIVEDTFQTLGRPTTLQHQHPNISCAHHYCPLPAVFLPTLSPFQNTSGCCAGTTDTAPISEPRCSTISPLSFVLQARRAALFIIIHLHTCIHIYERKPHVCLESFISVGN